MIYKSIDGKKKIFRFYEKQLKKLAMPYKDLYVNTSFGKTHLLETGNLNGAPLLLFHGGNTTTPTNLLTYCKFLLNVFHIYAVDLIGHPGKSAENCLSHKNYDYGKWASEVINAIGYQKIHCLGVSFGGDVLAKTMCVSPEKIEKAVLYIPSGIKNVPNYKNMDMVFPLMMYQITRKKKWLEKCILPMAITKKNINDDLFAATKCSMDNVKMKLGLPSNVLTADMKKCDAPTLVIAGENDRLFPAKLVIPQAEKIIPNCVTYVLHAKGHIHYLTKEEEQKIINFLK